MKRERKNKCQEVPLSLESPFSNGLCFKGLGLSVEGKPTCLHTLTDVLFNLWKHILVCKWIT